MAGRRAVPVDSDPFGDEVVYAWSMTTTDQRREVMYDWNNGRKQYHEKISILLHLNPNALRLACFLEFGHPSVCEPNGRPKAIHYGKLCEIMMEYPVDKCLKSVDNSPISVDKSVENPVDKNATYPQDEGFPQGMWMDSAELSTFPLFIHSLPVDKIY